MKKIFSLSAIVFACMMPFAAQSLECSVKPKVTSMEAPSSYMFVGNSYTYYSGGVAGVVNGLAKAAGIKVKRNRMVTIGAADLGWFDVWGLVRPSGMAATYVDHSDGGKIKRFDFRREKVFDAVILQDNSTGPINPQRKDIFEKYAKQHAYDLECFGIQPLIMMTWARKNKPEMTQPLADETTRVGNEANAMVIPVGLAFSEAIKKDPNLELYRADKTHPSPEGTYLEACVIFSTMFHRSPVGLKYYGIEPVNEKMAAFLQQVAWDTTCEYFGWTK